MAPFLRCTHPPRCRESAPWLQTAKLPDQAVANRPRRAPHASAGRFRNCHCHDPWQRGYPRHPDKACAWLVPALLRLRQTPHQAPHFFHVIWLLPALTFRDSCQDSPVSIQFKLGSTPLLSKRFAPARPLKLTMGARRASLISSNVKPSTCNGDAGLFLLTRWPGLTVGASLQTICQLAAPARASPSPRSSVPRNFLRVA